VQEISFSVAGYAPAKNEAKSMLAAGHIYADRVLALLRAAAAAAPRGEMLLFPSERLGLELTVVAVAAPPSDGTNYLGGVADVLEEKNRRGALEHLADLSTVALYNNDRQIEEVHYYYRRGEPTRYEVRIWVLDATD
jgi:hypothetical protein